MKNMTLFAMLGVVFLCGATAFAQDQPTSIEVSIDYSLVNFHPSAYGTGNSNLSGGGGSLVYYTPIKWFGLKMDLQGYSSRLQTFKIPAGNAVLPKGGDLEVNGNLFTYMFGPVIKKRGKIEPYAQVLIGGAHSNLYGNLFSATGAVGATPTNDAFAMVVGGGLDIHINRTFSVRPVEVGYLLTHFGNDAIGGGRNQNSFRYAAGATFDFK